MGWSDANKEARRLRKRLRQISYLRQRAEDRDLNDEEQEKVDSEAEARAQLQAAEQLLQSLEEPEPGAPADGPESEPGPGLQSVGGAAASAVPSHAPPATAEGPPSELCCRCRAADSVLCHLLTRSWHRRLGVHTRKYCPATRSSPGPSAHSCGCPCRRTWDARGGARQSGDSGGPSAGAS